MGVLHPAIEEVAAALGQGPDEGLHVPPGGPAEILRPLGILGYEHIADLYVALVLNGVLVLFDKVKVLAFANGSDLYVLHEIPNPVAPIHSSDYVLNGPGSIYIWNIRQ